MANLASKAISYLWDRRDKKKANMMKEPKSPVAPVNKLRLYMAIPAVLLFVSCVLSFLLIFAGSKPGILEEYSVFTLNVSRIGEGIHQKVDGAIAGINLGDLHVDLKQNAPVYSPAMATPAPTTLLTMAPRDLRSAFESLTKDSGHQAASANSAAHSKASQVKSKASSAANAAETSTNNGLDSAARKIKAKLTEVADDSFKDIIAKLDLKDFYSIYVTTTCEGAYSPKEGKEGETPKVTACEKDSALNPMKWVGVFYWMGAASICVAFCLCLFSVYKPAGRWIGWTNLFIGLATVSLLVASVLSHGIAEGSQRLVNFVGDGISVTGIAGMKFIGLSWATTLMLPVIATSLLGMKWYIKRHPEKAEKDSSGPLGRFGRLSISGPQPILKPAPAYTPGEASGYRASSTYVGTDDGAGESYQMKGPGDYDRGTARLANQIRQVDSRPPTRQRGYAAPARSNSLPRPPDVPIQGHASGVIDSSWKRMSAYHGGRV